MSGYPDRVLPRDAAAAAELKKRTLNYLYNDRPTWLDNAHRDLDAAVAAAYGWPEDISTEDALAALLELNGERAAAQGKACAFIADTAALILFFTATGLINEHFIAGMAWEQVLHARLLGAALMIPVGRPYGIWRDWIMRYARPDRLSRLLWDSLALVSFQVPIYAAIIAVSGASGTKLLYGLLGATVIMLVCGRPYGAFLGWVRSRFHVQSDSLMPMSINTP